MRTAADYYAQLRAMLPPGPAWDASLVPELDAVLQALAPQLAAVDQRAAELFNEGTPRGEHELLTDWERVMDLPDACLGELPTLDDRKIAVRQRRTRLGDQRIAFFVELAVSHGFPGARVVEHRTPRFGRSRFGSARFGTWAAQFMWTLYTGERRRVGRRFGSSYWGERFGMGGATALECLARRSAPAHTVVRVLYEEST